MKTAAQLIAEIDRAQAAREQLAAEQDERSTKMLAWLVDELNTAAVRVRYNDPEIKLVAGDGPGFVIDRYGKLLCRVCGYRRIEDGPEFCPKVQESGKLGVVDAGNRRQNSSSKPSLAE